jgi:hypothetical protein
MPWSGMKRVTDDEAGELVSIPKFWYKLTMDEAGLHIQIADGEADGFSVSPAHMDRGDGAGERDVVYIGRYHCATGTYKSATGVMPQVKATRADFRTSIHDLGYTIWQCDIAMRFTLWLLYLVEFADWNSQVKIGYGCSASDSIETSGKTDSMPYHTGTTAAAQTTYGYTQYRNIEGLWDTVQDWMDGCYYNDDGLYIILSPANFSDSSGGTLLGLPTDGYPSVLGVGTSPFLMFYPAQSHGGAAVCVPDYWVFRSSLPCLVTGGYFDTFIGQNFGLFYVGCQDESYAENYVGGRIQKLP